MHNNKQKITISNASSETFNYLLYVRNVYLNLKKDEMYFPNYKFNQAGTLSYSDFNNNFLALWEKAMNEYTNKGESQYFFGTDHNFQEDFSVLFERNLSGENVSREIWNSFKQWWWSQPSGGNVILETISDWGMERIWSALQELLQDCESKISVSQYFIIPLFKSPPELINCDSYFFHLESAESFIPVIKHKEIANRIFNNLTKMDIAP